MDEITYTENNDAAILTSEIEGEWIQSDSVIVLSDWA